MAAEKQTAIVHKKEFYDVRCNRCDAVVCGFSRTKEYALRLAREHNEQFHSATAAEEKD